MVGYYINKLNEKWESSIKGERRLDGPIYIDRLINIFNI